VEQEVYRMAISRQSQIGYISIKKMAVHIGTGRYTECCRDIFPWGQTNFIRDLISMKLKRISLYSYKLNVMSLISVNFNQNVILVQESKTDLWLVIKV
jgi:hypothetical protein